MDFDGQLTLTSWYVNQHRIVELLGDTVLDGTHNHPALLASLIGPRVLKWVQERDIPSFERLFLEKRVGKGSVFFHEARYYSQGMKDLNAASPRLRFPLKDLEEGNTGSLFLPFHTDNLTTSSAFGAIKGCNGLYVCGVVTDLQGMDIVARPLVIGHLVQDFGGINPRYSKQVEGHIIDFDVFRDIDLRRRVSLKQLEELKGFPELAIKSIFAEAMNEPYVDADWGGEMGDLYTANAMVDEYPTTCGFMFKGPAKFRKLHIADCGKRGDQIMRLFEYPADYFVLQHCHAVDPRVRILMRAMALEKARRGVRFCVIDGFLTYAILRHLKKL